MRRSKTLDFGKQINFTSTQSLTIPYTPSLTSFSVAFWIKKNRYVSGARIIDWQDSGPIKGFKVSQDGVQDKISIFVGGSDFAVSTNTFPEGKYIHVVCTYFFSGTGRVSIYINGVLNMTNASIAQMIASTTTLTIGNRSTGSGANPAESKLDNVLFYDKELTQTEISNLVFDGIIPSGLKAGYNFDNSDGTDFSGNGYTGTVTGATFVTDPPYKLRASKSHDRYTPYPRLMARDYGTSIKLFNATDKIDAGIDFIGVGAMSFTGWIRFNGLGGNGGGRVFDNGNCILNVSATFGGSLQFRSDGATSYFTYSPTFSVPSRWIFVAVTRDAAGLANIYINGVLSGSANQNSGTPGAATSNLFIGNKSDLSRNSNANFDSFRFFRRVLTVQEINSIMLNNSVPRDVLTAEYLFNEGAGSTANDTSPNANHPGTITGGTYSTDVPKVARASV
jgi:hypothetical protein